jgi:SagB-type dehydrogenase family enzyme
MRKSFVLCLALLVLSVSTAVAQGSNNAAAAPAADAIKIALPAPSQSGGMTLTQALATRRSVRAYAPTPLTQAELSQILWAAQGITDKDGRRTAPSAGAQYYLHVYVANANGFFEYLPKGHQLQKLADQDLRSKLSAQQSVNQAPTVLLITGEYERTAQKYGPEKGPRFVNIETGHVAQNVLLQATAIGLSAVPVGGIDPKEVQKAASLPAQYSAIYLVPIGHAK